MKKELIGMTGATYLLLAGLIAKTFTVFPRMLATKVATSAWLVVLLAGIVAVPGFLALSALLRRFPGKSLGRATKEALGPVAGGVVCLIYVLYFIFLGGIFLREFEASFRIAVLPRTPASALMVTFSLAVAYVAFKGMETISRMAAYLMPLLLGLFLLTALGTLRLLDLTNLLPLWGNGVATTLLLPFPETSLYSELLALGAMAGMLRAQDIHQVGLRAHLGAVALMTMSLVLLGGVFPHPALSRLHFPMLDVARSIQAGEFLQRVEAIFVMFWFFFGSFKVALTLLCAAIFFSDLAGLKQYRPLVFPVTLLAYTVAFLPADTVVTALLDSYTIRVWSWAVSFGLPGLTLAVAALRRKQGGVSDALSG